MPATPPRIAGLRPTNSTMPPSGWRRAATANISCEPSYATPAATMACSPVADSRVMKTYRPILVWRRLRSRLDDVRQSSRCEAPARFRSVRPASCRCKLQVHSDTLLKSAKMNLSYSREFRSRCERSLGLAIAGSHDCCIVVAGK